MKIGCKLCGHSIESSAKEAQTIVLEAMARHLVERHQRESIMLREEINSLYMLLTSYLMIKHYVRIPLEETGLVKSFEEGEQALLDLFGVSRDNAS